MSNTGLLILTNPARVGKLLPVIKRHVLKTLYIQYFPEKNFVPSNFSISSLQWKKPHNSQLIANIYALASTILTVTDVRVLISNAKKTSATIDTKKPIELVIFDTNCSKDEARSFIKTCLTNSTKTCDFLAIGEEGEEQIIDENVEKNSGKVYNNVVLGGTFDRLHNGHKILLSEAVVRCKERLTIGVTDESMITSKILWELIRPVEERIRNLKEFLDDVDCSLKYDIVPISDLYGPTKSDPTFEMIVVSEETQKGAQKINDLRKEKHLGILDVHVVKLAQDTLHDDHEDSKISSSNQRIRLLGTRLKEPDLKGKPLKPYIIGLTGGIASGKSSVANKLQALGAGIVHCDKLVHDLYEPGQECFDLVVKIFGKKVLSPEGKIDRKELGNIVFNDKRQLDKLNAAVWPATLKAATEKINQLHLDGFDIVVMEAAVLIQAKWQFACHEIWTCIIPHKEAVTRLIERNGLTAEEAEARISVQPSNVEQVNAATVILSTLWSHEVTLAQVTKAWNELKGFLSQRV